MSHWDLLKKFQWNANSWVPCIQGSSEQLLDEFCQGEESWASATQVGDETIQDCT